MTDTKKTIDELIEENQMLALQVNEMSASAHQMINAQSHLESVLHNAGEGVILFNSDKTIKSLNLAAEKIFGYQEIELMYQHANQLFNTPKEFVQDIPAYLKHYLLAHPDPSKDPLLGFNNKGESIPLHISVSEVASSDMVLFDDFSADEETGPADQFELFALIVYDMSNEIAAKQLLQEKNTQLEQAYISLSEHDRLRSEFLAKVSHELLTPLNGIIGMADILADEVTQEQQELVVVIKDSGLRLESIISNILSFENNNGCIIEKVHFNLIEMFKELEANFSQLRAAKKLDWSLNIEDADDLSDVFDFQEHLQRIISNLIDNALKFTHSGGISVNLAIDKYNATHCHVIISIQDSGIGIAHDDQEKVFHPFVQLEDTVTREFGGVGMGLAIVKQLMGNLNGQLELQSELGQGTIIILNLIMEFAAEQQRNHAPISEEKLSQLKQLMGDDFKLLVTTSITELHKHFETLQEHIAQKQSNGVYASSTLLMNIADQIGAQYFINCLNSFNYFYDKHKFLDASDELQSHCQIMTDEIELVVQSLNSYYSQLK